MYTVRGQECAKRLLAASPQPNSLVSTDDQLEHWVPRQQYGVFVAKGVHALLEGSLELWFGEFDANHALSRCEVLSAVVHHNHVLFVGVNHLEDELANFTRILPQTYSIVSLQFLEQFASKANLW